MVQMWCATKIGLLKSHIRIPRFHSVRRLPFQLCCQSSSTVVRSFPFFSPGICYVVGNEVPRLPQQSAPLVRVFILFFAYIPYGQCRFQLLYIFSYCFSFLVDTTTYPILFPTNRLTPWQHSFGIVIWEERLRSLELAGPFLLRCFCFIVVRSRAKTEQVRHEIYLSQGNSGFGIMLVVASCCCNEVAEARSISS